MQQQQQAIPEGRKLPKKEMDLYRSIVKYYEIKQYKKARKSRVCMCVCVGLLAGWRRGGDARARCWWAAAADPP